MVALFKKDIQLVRRIVSGSMLAGVVLSLLLIRLSNMDVAGVLLANTLLFFILVLGSKLVNHTERQASFFVMTLPVRLSDLVRSKYILAIILFLTDWVVVVAGLAIGHLWLHFNLTVAALLQGFFFGLGLVLFALSFVFFIYFVFKNYTYAKLLLVPVLFLSSFSSSIVHSSFSDSIGHFLNHVSLTVVSAVFMAGAAALYGVSLTMSLLLTKGKDV